MGDDRAILRDEDLEKVAGGRLAKAAAGAEPKNKEFEAAWKALGLDSKYSGMKRAEIYDEWEMAGFTPEATAFLAKYC